MASYRTGLSRARGLGSARHGARHWIMERVTAVALIPLVLWMVYSAFTLAVTDYSGALLWVGHPFNAVLLMLLVGVGFWHMHDGLKVVIEDYIHKTFGKSVLLLLNLFVCMAGAALALFSLLKIAFMGAAI